MPLPVLNHHPFKKNRIFYRQGAYAAEKKSAKYFPMVSRFPSLEQDLSLQVETLRRRATSHVQETVC